jgi:hypothetical protein
MGLLRIRNCILLQRNFRVFYAVKLYSVFPVFMFRKFLETYRFFTFKVVTLILHPDVRGAIV